MASQCVCVCGCGCGGDETKDALCGSCWFKWCRGEGKHSPRDGSYVATYGLTNVWTGWLISRGYAEIVALPPSAMFKPERAPRCPACVKEAVDIRMVRRPGGWKCYHHDPPAVVADRLDLPRTPRANVLPRKE